MTIGSGTGGSSGNTLPAGQCACPGKWDVFSETAVETTTAGTKVVQYSLTCKACEESEFPGPGWQCKRCSDFREEY